MIKSSISIHIQNKPYLAIPHIHLHSAIGQEHLNYLCVARFRSMQEGRVSILYEQPMYEMIFKDKVYSYLILQIHLHSNISQEHLHYLSATQSRARATKTVVLVRHNSLLVHKPSPCATATHSGIFLPRRNQLCPPLKGPPGLCSLHRPCARAPSSHERHLED